MPFSLSLKNLAFNAIKNPLLQSLSVPEKLADIVTYVQNLLPTPAMENLNHNLTIDYKILEAFEKASSIVKPNLSLFSFYDPIVNPCGAISSGFSALSQAITGTARLEYQLRIIISIYFSQNEDEMKAFMQKLSHHLRTVISFKEELEKCLMKNANHLSMYAISRVLRCTIHHWVVVSDPSKGEIRFSLQQLIPPKVETDQIIEILEIVGEPFSRFCLLMAKKPQSPSAVQLGNNTLQRVSCLFRNVK